MNSARLTRGPKWQRQLVGLGARAAVVAWACVRALGWLGRAAGCEAHFFFSFHYFSFLFHLFEFKFGLEFEFKTEVTCSLEF